MADVLETELNNLIFRAQRAQAEFNDRVDFIERVEWAANALREVELQVMARLTAAAPTPPPIPWNGHHVAPNALDWRQ